MTEINQTGIFKNQISKTEYLSVLRLMKRYKIIDYDFNSNDYEEDNVIYIFPTVLYVVKIDNINMLTEKIKTYVASKGDEEDEINED